MATFYFTNGDEDECGAKWKQMDSPTPLQEVEQQASSLQKRYNSIFSHPFWN